MIERNVMLSKAGNLDRRLKRIRDKRAVSLEAFLEDQDRQEIILFNLQMAIQDCIDIAAHIISDEELGAVGSTNEMFYLLQENGYIDFDLAESMTAAVGFRNLIAHEYGKLDLTLVYRIVHQSTQDLENYMKAVLQKSGVV